MESMGTRRRGGLTLIELTVVMVCIAIVAVLVMPAFSSVSSTQLRAAVQLTYVFDKIKNTKLQPQLFGQLGVAWGRSYDATEHRWVGSNQAGLGLGAGLNYEIDKKNTAGLAATAGPTFVGDGAILLDLGTQITWTVTFD